MDLLPFLTGAIGGLIGGGLGFAANYARHRWDMHTKRIEAFCAETERTADRATAYWLDPVVSYEMADGVRMLGGSTLTAEKEKSAASTNLVEKQIVASQSKLASMGALIRIKLSLADAQTYDMLLKSYFTSLSDGDFEVRTGRVELDRASAIQFFSASLTSHVRLASERFFTLRETSGIAPFGRMLVAGARSKPVIQVQRYVVLESRKAVSKFRR